MLSAKEQREARRRKILERGADRLAYIARQGQAVPREPESKPQPQPEPQQPELELQDAEIKPAAAEPDSTTTSVLQFTQGWRELQEPAAKAPPGFPASPTHGFDAVVTSRLLQDVQSQMQALDLGRAEQEAARAKPELTSPLPTSVGGVGFQQQLDQQPRKEGKSKISGLRSCKAWSQSIRGTELARAVFALLLGLVVFGLALLPCEHPSKRFLWLGGVGWPLSLIIVTDITLVLGALLSASTKVPPGVQDRPVAGDDQFSRTLNAVNRMGDQLEKWMTVFEAVQGVTLDCSVYVVSLTSAVSVAQFCNLPLCLAVPTPGLGVLAM